jgi:hypothetical protein
MVVQLQFQQLQVTGDHPQRLTQVVGCGIGELLEFSIGAAQFGFDTLVFARELFIPLARWWERSG